MSDNPETRPFARAILQDTPETAERFHGYGLKGFSYARIGLEEGLYLYSSSSRRQVSSALLPVDQVADAHSHAAVVLAEAEG